MIQANKISLAFGQQKIFDSLSFSVQENERIGLMGRNGSGKSTLLKVIVDQHQLDSGSISIINGKSIAYMPQEVVLASDKSIFQETMTTFEKIYQLEQEINHLETDVIEGRASQDMIDRYAYAHEQLNHEHPARARAEVERILIGLGFKESELNSPVSTLSVGWKMRIVLAKLLLKKANFYLFDEPTNHLDITAKDWFLNFLKTTSFGFMLVCHDRYFLDKVCDKLLELEIGKATFYSGNYEQYLEQKEHALKTLEGAAAQQEKEIKRKLDTANRFRAKSSKAKMAQSILKSVAKIERIELPPSIKNVHFSFPPVTKSGRIVLTVKNVSHSFDDKQIFKNVSFAIERGQKVAIIAPNGVGKTTLFNLIVNKLPLQNGSIEPGYNVEHAIFDQDQNRALDMNDSILNNVSNRCSGKSEQAVRSFLGNFLFSNDDVHKKIKVLSGGEKNRVGMVSTLLQDANLLLLDEPTNHLDIQTKEILLKALRQTDATMLFVSHDHYFVNHLATHIIELTPDGAHMYHGNYNSFLAQKGATQATFGGSGRKPAKAKKAENKKELIELKKECTKMERKIDKLEKEIKKVEHGFADLEYGTDDFIAAERKLTDLKNTLKETLATWERVHAKLSF